MMLVNDTDYNFYLNHQINIFKYRKAWRIQKKVKKIQKTTNTIFPEPTEIIV